MAKGTVADPAQEPLTSFDAFAETYEEDCHRGLSLTGESREYFAQCRVRATAESCRLLGPVAQVLDFGCGLGHATLLLQEAFPQAAIVGLDNSEQSIRRAAMAYGGERARFVTSLLGAEASQFDVAYCNGVFHHIPPAERLAAARSVHAALREDGLFALWENNPWNPGTRIVMSRIPFDRDAIMLSAREARNLLRSAGFTIVGTTFHFFFPSFLRGLRKVEPRLAWFPLGGQYCVLAKKPAHES